MSMSFKASPDGTYGEILVNGQVVAKLPVTGNAVIPGLVGTVSQSGGVPTGAVVERGSNANGNYVRFADGTQICSHFVTPFSATLDTIWVFPAEFAGSSINISIFGGTNTSVSTTLYMLGIGNPTLTEVPLKNFAISVGGPLARNEAGSRVCAIGRWY